MTAKILSFSNKVERERRKKIERDLAATIRMLGDNEEIDVSPLLPLLDEAKTTGKPIRTRLRPSKRLLSALHCDFRPETDSAFVVCHPNGNVYVEVH